MEILEGVALEVGCECVEIVRNGIKNGDEDECEEEGDCEVLGVEPLLGDLGVDSLEVFLVEVALGRDRIGMGERRFGGAAG